MEYIFYFFILLKLLVFVEGNGEKYDLETYNLMQILRPIGSSIINGTNIRSPITYDGRIHVSKKLYPSLFFLHFHIPKTGGTTFKDLVVVNNSQGIDRIKNCGFTYVGHKSSGAATKYASTLDVIKSGCSYYSHESGATDCKFYLDTIEFNLPYKNIRSMTMIRQPLDHAFSAIGHYARYHEKGNLRRCSGLHAYLGKFTSSSFFLQQLCNIHIGGNCEMYDLHNLQTTRLASGNLTNAMDILDKMFWVGITEYFDASICLLAYQLGQFNEKLCDCKQKPKNVAAHKNVSYFNDIYNYSHQYFL